MAQPLKPLAQVSRERGVHIRRLRRAIHSGELRGFQPGERRLYCRDDDVDRWLVKQQVAASPSVEARAEAIVQRMRERT